MEEKIDNTNQKLKSQDKPGFHRAKGEQHALTSKEKKEAAQKAGNKANKKKEPFQRGKDV